MCTLETSTASQIRVRWFPVFAQPFRHRHSRALGVCDVHFFIFTDNKLNSPRQSENGLYALGFPHNDMEAAPFTLTVRIC